MMTKTLQEKNINELKSIKLCSAQLIEKVYYKETIYSIDKRKLKVMLSVI